MTVAIRNRKPSNSTGGTATRASTGTVLCQKLVVKEGSTVLYNGTYAEGNWAEILRQFNSAFMGLTVGKTITFTSKAVMARPTPIRRN